MFNPQKKPKVYVLRLGEERLERNFVLGQVQLSQTASYVGIGILLRLTLFAITSSKLKKKNVCMCVAGDHCSGAWTPKQIGKEI